MLTRQQRVYHWDRRASSISSDRLAEADLPHLERALGVYQSMTGERLGRVRDAARAVLEGLRPDRVEAVVQLLDDAATYEWPRGGQQAERRGRLFELASRHHPSLDPEAGAPLVSEVFVAAPRQHGERVALLYADYPEFHRLARSPPTTPPKTCGPTTTWARPRPCSTPRCA